MEINGTFNALLAERTLFIPRLPTTTKTYSSIREKTYFHSHKFDVKWISTQASGEGGKVEY